MVPPDGIVSPFVLFVTVTLDIRTVAFVPEAWIPPLTVPGLTKFPDATEFSIARVMVPPLIELAAKPDPTKLPVTKLFRIIPVEPSLIIMPRELPSAFTLLNETFADPEGKVGVTTAAPLPLFLKMTLLTNNVLDALG